MSIVLCSLLIGAGYDAYCVCGYATREVTLMDQTRDICPLLKQENKVSASLIPFYTSSCSGKSRLKSFLITVVVHKYRSTIRV